jgi:predicted PurR-regulated permease PerM
MTITDVLLLAILIVLGFVAALLYVQHRELVKWLDALGDAVTDLLTAINNNTKKG